MPKVKTIAFVSDAVFPYHKGGKETRLFELSTRLAKQSFDVHIYCMKWWTGKSDIIENGVHLHAICSYIPLYDGSRRSIKEGILFGLACFKLLKVDFDILDADHMPYFPLFSLRIVCWLKGKKMIGTWNEVWGQVYWQEYLPGVKSYIASFLEKASIKMPDEIVSISPLTTEKLISVFHFPKEKIFDMACGYDKKRIAVVVPASEKSDVIFVGRLLSHKHVDVLIRSIEVFKKNKQNIICRIVGIGPERETLHQLVKELKLGENIIFHGELEQQSEIFALMKASKVFVLPSTREGFGIVALEANACGLPVITVDHPDNASKEIAQITTSLDPESLAKEIEGALRNKKKSFFQNKIKENLRKYEWNSIVDTYVEKILV